MTIGTGCQMVDSKPSTVNNTGISYAGGDGSNFETAVIIQGAADEMVGVRAEQVWLALKYPAYQFQQQSLQEHQGKNYDVIDITTRDGQQRQVYFDISAFFGK
jgi:hypothetical protein